MHKTLSALVQQCVVRLRQVPGVTTQSYAEGLLAALIEECYEECRQLRWWDHLTEWRTVTLDGVTGTATTDFATPVRERLRDIQAVYAGSQTTPLPLLSQHSNPIRYTGTTPRAYEALPTSQDPTGVKVLRVYPLASTGDLQLRMRVDDPGMFTVVGGGTVIPFDATALVNGACMKYAIGDGTNPGAVAEFDRAYNERVQGLVKQHDSTSIVLDDRTRSTNEWQEDYR
jgi:hypothetical protein